MRPEYESINKRLQELPVLIYEKEKQIIDVNGKLEDTNYALSSKEKYIINEVTVETDADGKKLFSNQSMREAETLKRLQTNSEYQSVKTTARELEKSKAVFEIEHKKLYNEYSAVKYMIRVLELERMEDISMELRDKDRVITELRTAIQELKKAKGEIDG